MKEILDNGYIKLIPSDWGYASAIVGLKRFFDNLDLKGYTFTSEEFIYNPEFLTEDNFAEFIDTWYGTKLRYNKALEILQNNDEFDNKLIKEINNLLTQNKILKNIFSIHKFNGTNKEEIISLIKEHKKEFALDLFKNMEGMYKKYCNQSCFMRDDVGVRRLIGFYEYMGAKSKHLSWQFKQNTFSYNDCMEFDFIPFGFSYGLNSCFINSNYDLNTLFKVNDDLIRNLSDKKNPTIADIISSITDLIEYNCEIIINKNDCKNSNKEYFESIFLHPQILSKIDIAKQYINKLGFVKQNDEFVNLGEIAYEYLINSINLDRIICKLFKIIENSRNEENNEQIIAAYINSLIYINLIINERNTNMEEKIKNVKICANLVSAKLTKNQINSFKQKLICAVTYDDKDSVLKILTKLSDTSEVSLNFIYDILEDYETNKNLVYAFINKLNYKENDDKENK